VHHVLGGRWAYARQTLPWAPDHASRR
jgi:hypothetical protein